MILGVLSDTHGNLGLMKRAVAALTERVRASHLVHLGDDWEDKLVLELQGYSVTGVPGLWCEAYHDRHVPRVRIDVFDGLRVVCAHDPQLLLPLDGRADLLLSGHTHCPVIERRQGIPHMNPGHLKSPKDRGREATFGVVDIREEKFELLIYGLDGKVRQSGAFPRKQATEESHHGPRAQEG